MSSVRVEIVSAEDQLYSGQATMVVAPAQNGEIGITPGHMALISTLQPGEVRIKQEDGREDSIYVSGGIIEVQPHVITILSDTAHRAADLDELKAQQAMEAAEKALDEHDTEVDVAQARAEIAQAAAQLRLIRKMRGK